MKYKTSGWRKLIEAVKADRETEHFVWLAGSQERHAKRSSWLNYYDTWEEAKASLLKTRESELKSAQRNLDHARSKYEEIKQLKGEGK